MDRLRYTHSAPHNSLFGLALVVLVWLGVVYMALGSLMPGGPFTLESPAISASAADLRASILQALPGVKRVDDALERADRIR